MRVCNVLRYMPQVVADSEGHPAADETTFVSAKRESMCDATSTLPTQMGDSIPPEATESVRTIHCNAEGMPTVEVANQPLIGANPGTTPGAVWATESDLLRATVLAQQSSSAKTAQGRCNEHELVDRLLSEGGGGGLGQQEVTSNSGAPPPMEITVRIMLPDGSSEMVCAMLDTGSKECNVTSYERAMRWRAAKAKGTFTGKPVAGASLESYEGATKPSFGTLQLRCEVNPQHVPIPASMQFDFECEVSETLADGIDLIIGRSTLFSTGLLRAVVLAESQTPEAFAQTLKEATLEEEEEFWTIPELGEFTMPKVYGTTEQKEQLTALVTKYAHLFGPAPKGGSLMSELDIKVKPGAKPTYQPPRRVSPAIQQVIAEDTAMRVENGWMAKAPNEYARYGSPVVVALQKGKYRVCTDYRAINLITEPCRHPVKDVQQTLEQCRGSKVWSMMDLRKGFHQLRLSKRTQELLTVVTLQGAYRPLTAPFGEKSIPAEYQWRMSHEVLAEGTGPNGEVQDQLEDRGICTFVDDLLCHSGTFAEHLQLLERLFIRLDMYKLRLNGAKCSFGREEAEFLGLRVNEHGYQHTAARKQAILDMQRPVDAHQLKSLLGLANYMRGHCGPDYAVKIQPLNAVSHSFQWGPEQQAAFDWLKQRIGDIGLLHFLDYSKDIHVAVDASEDGVGGVLYQYDSDGNMQVAAYASRAFNSTERKWSTLEQEAYAVLHCVTKFESHLLGHHFHLHTDHRNVLNLWSLQAPKVQRWRCKLSEYDFTIHHIPGIENKIPDALSRLHGEHKVYRLCTVTRSQVAINQELVDQIVVHHNSLVGHVGLHELLHRMEEAGFRNPRNQPGYLRRHCEYVLANCAACQKIKERKPDSEPALKSLAVHEPGAEWSVDLAGPFPADKNGNTYIVVAVDSFSRFVMAKAVKSTKAEETAQFLLEIAAIFGLPASLRSDNARAPFVNEIMTALLRLVNVERKAAIAYLPRTNGTVERWIAELTKHLRYLVIGAGLKERWSEYLPLAVRIINATRTAGIGCAPAEIVFGGRVHLNRNLVPTQVPKELADGLETIPDRTRRFEVKAYVEHLTHAQYNLIATANKWQDNVIEQRIKTNRKTRKFASGDWVVISWDGTESRPGKNRPSKLATTWRGPYKVIGQSRDSLISVQDPADLCVYEFPVARCYLYNMGMSDDPVEIIAWDTDEAIVESIVDHSMPSNRRGEWRFLARFKDSGPEDDVWIPWQKANELPALDRYSTEHPELNIPGNQRNLADRKQSAPGGRGFVAKKRQCGASSTKGP